MKNVRKEFPALQRFTYLNTPASGLLSETVLEFRQEHDLDFLIGGSVFREKTDAYMTATRETVGNFFHCKPSNVALTPNFSMGFNLLLEGIPKTASILLLQNDYPSINLAVKNRDFEVNYVEMNENLEKNIEQAVVEHQPDFMAFSVVQWINGIKIELDFLKKLKQKYPDLVLIADGTQYCGAEVFDFENSAIDVLGASAYKWLNAGYGNAFFLFKENAQKRFFPKGFGFGSTVGKYKETEGNFIGKLEPGHLDTLNFGSLKTALDLQTQVGPELIQEKIKSLAEKAKTAFDTLGLLEEAVVRRKNHSSIFNLKGDEKLFQKLRSNHIICVPRGEGVRVGFHYFNTEEELDLLVNVLRN